jgi:hypothetical protein
MKAGPSDENALLLSRGITSAELFGAFHERSA